jgi:DNA-directed RNA polymerase subunit RPC12/RpoP
MNLQCPHCLHRWFEKLALPMNLTAAAQRMKAMSFCVKCGKAGALIDNKSGEP